MEYRLLGVQQFWFGMQSAYPLALMRICFGLVMLLSFGFEMFSITDFYSAEGFVPGEYVPAFYRELRFSLLDYFTSPFEVYILYSLLLVSLFLFTIGYKTNYVKIIQFLLILSFHERNFLLLNSGDTLIRVMSFYLMMSPCANALSIDRIKKGAKKVSMWSIRLIQIQMCIMYLFAGLSKVATEPWRDGSAVNYIVRNNIFNRFEMDWVAFVPEIIIIVSWLSLVLELLFPFIIWVPKARIAALIGGAFLHLGIFLVIDVGWFSLATIAAYPIFLTSKEILQIFSLVKKSKIINKLNALLPK